MGCAVVKRSLVQPVSVGTEAQPALIEPLRCEEVEKPNHPEQQVQAPSGNLDEFTLFAEDHVKTNVDEDPTKLVLSTGSSKGSTISGVDIFPKLQGNDLPGGHPRCLSRSSSGRGAFMTSESGPLRAQIGDGEQFHSTYHIMTILGKGAYAQVHLVRNVHTDEQFATKVTDLRRNASEKDAFIEETCKKEFEVMLKAANSEYCVGAIAAYIDDSHCYILMERCESALVDVMENAYFDEMSLRHVVRDTLKGLDHIHRWGIIHRDVKPENLLFSAEDERHPKGRIRLCDFGLAHYEKGSLEPAEGAYGTAPYMCPEMLHKQTYDGKADIWSLGTMVYVIQLGHFPYTPPKKTSALMKEAIRRGEPPSYKPSVPLIQPTQVALNFIASCLQRKPFARMSADQALQHAYVNGELSPQDKACITTLRPTLHAARNVGAFGPKQPHKKAVLDEAIVMEQTIHSSRGFWNTRGPLANMTSQDGSEDPGCKSPCGSPMAGRCQTLTEEGMLAAAAQQSPRSAFPPRSNTMCMMDMEAGVFSLSSSPRSGRFTAPETGRNPAPGSPTSCLGSPTARSQILGIHPHRERRMRRLTNECRRLNELSEAEEQREEEQNSIQFPFTAILPGSPLTANMPRKRSADCSLSTAVTLTLSTAGSEHDHCKEQVRDHKGHCVDVE